MKAIAYVHGPDRVHILANAFAQGCSRHGVVCEIRRVDELGDEKADVVFMYGLGQTRNVFDAHEGALRLVGDKGYFSEYKTEDRAFRISVNAQQPDAHLRLRAHPSDRWEALGINVEPVTERGDYILLCGVGPKQSQIIRGIPYGSWERAKYSQLRDITDRPILVREKPKNMPIQGLPRAPTCKASEAIRGAFAVVCMTGNIGVDAILEGVPVFAEAGPGKVYYPQDVEELETVKPLTQAQRLAALSDIAYWQWKPSEMASGDFWESLKLEWLV